VQRIGLAKCSEMVRVEDKSGEFHTNMEIIKENNSTEPSEEEKGSDKEAKEGEECSLRRWTKVSQ
jgi:hypothetical protein